ncbi:multicopper oxidase domain-containing protein [Xanthobacter dioxanivorans]|uniref:Multicopper oxidase domain-containing protein n=1 Tax=Xanthobacter dioxanivorans TaxID=2528964 RepID=A0A974SGJ9_9HYPH|nr:multicopper oxidase domain-containing protein [Xanthobacter dioxanivorans]QRG04780.1 multicopper oxidase domain-containing protein [Xanthobacter dioxanivorans]
MNIQPLAPTAVLTRRRVLALGAGAGVAALLQPRAAWPQPAPLLAVESTTIEVNGKPAKVFAVKGPAGSGVMARQGDRLTGALLNASGIPLQMHWHGQVLAPPDQDRARPGGGELPSGGSDQVDFLLTPGTHWMHSHTLAEQQLLAAPLVTREADAGDVQDVVVMLHDFAFRSPEEILAELGGTDAHGGGHGAHAMGGAAPHAGHPMPGMGGQSMMDQGMGHQGMSMPGMGGMGGGMTGASGHAMGGMPMVHANDVAYDAFLANHRTLADPEVVQVEKGGRVRLRIINGGTATAFFISMPGLAPRCIAVDGSPCAPAPAAAFPLAQGQRIDLLVEIPAGGGAFPVLAQVEAAAPRTGIILATAGAAVSRVAETAGRPAGLLDLAFESTLSATSPLAARTPDRTFAVMLGEAPGYRWTINGRIHGEHQPFVVRQGERVEMTFMNPTAMTHPMHLHGHHFQVVGIGGRRVSGPVRDTVIVPPHAPVTIAFDAGQKGEWFLHCHHLYHMATGMMTVLQVT